MIYCTLCALCCDWPTGMGYEGLLTPRDTYPCAWALAWGPCHLFFFMRFVNADGACESTSEEFGRFTTYTPRHSNSLEVPVFYFYVFLRISTNISGGGTPMRPTSLQQYLLGAAFSFFSHSHSITKPNSYHVVVTFSKMSLSSIDGLILNHCIPRIVFYI